MYQKALGHKRSRDKIDTAVHESSFPMVETSTNLQMKCTLRRLFYVGLDARTEQNFKLPPISSIHEQQQILKQETGKIKPHTIPSCVIFKLSPCPTQCLKG